MANMKNCSSCNKNNLKAETVAREMVEDDMSEDDDDLEAENVIYNHVCAECNHIISRHKYKFWLEDGRQEYRMDCLLCGFAEDSISVMPSDPRKASSMEF